MEPIEEIIKRVKEFRVAMDVVLQQMKQDSHKSRELSLAITKLQEAIMWCGMDLKELNGGVSCYPNGKDPSNAIVDPIPDGVKL